MSRELREKIREVCEKTIYKVKVEEKIGEAFWTAKKSTTGMSTHCQCETFHIDARGLRREISKEREGGSRDKEKAIACFSVRGRPGLNSKGEKGDETNDKKIQKVCVGKRAGSE